MGRNREPTGLRNELITRVRKRNNVVDDNVGLATVFARLALALLVAIPPNAISQWRFLAPLFGRSPEPNSKPSSCNFSRSAALKRYGFNKPLASQKSKLLKPVISALSRKTV